MKVLILIPEKNAVNSGVLTCTCISMSQIYADTMANSEDPDQTAPQGGLIWVWTVCLPRPFCQKTYVYSVRLLLVA